MTSTKGFCLPKSLIPYKKSIEETFKQCAHLNYEPDNSKNISTQFGGNPLLSPHRSIPTDISGIPMPLLAQIDFAEINLEDPFPQEGILQIFINNDFGNKYHSIDTEQFFIQFLNPSEKNLSLHPKSNIILLNPYFPIQKEIKLVPTVQHEPVSSLDYRYNYYFQDINHKIVTDDERTFEEIYFEAFLGAEHKIGGYPYFIENDFRLQDTSLKKYDTLLLQIVTDDHHHICYRDSGIISFFIARRDLQNLDFSNIYCHKESY